MRFMLLPPRRQQARLVRKHETLERLGFCAQKITVSRPAWCKVFHRVKTRMRAEPKTIGELGKKAPQVCTSTSMDRAAERALLS
jgi:hypothetical protein